MNQELAKGSLGWGFVLWLIGYVLGIALFFLLPPSVIGWVILPVGVVITLWVLMTRIHSDSLQHYAFIAAVWTVLAIVLDYVFIVKAFSSADGYYKLDVYLYYALTFALPLIAGVWKTSEMRRMRPA